MQGTIALPTRPTDEQDVPRFLLSCNDLLDHMAQNPPTLTDERKAFNNAGIQMHTMLEDVVKQWPTVKNLPEFLQVIKRLLADVFGIGGPVVKAGPPQGTTRFYFVAWVDCATKDEAEQVMAERLGPDEDYGFDYTVDYKLRATMT